MSETINVICDNCGAKPKHVGNHAGWVTTKARASAALMNTVTISASSSYLAGTFRAELDLCPQCVAQIRAAKANGYPNAPERVAA